jgi:hypothetical protein
MLVGLVGETGAIGLYGLSSDVWRAVLRFLFGLVCLFVFFFFEHFLFDVIFKGKRMHVQSQILARLKKDSFKRLDLIQRRSCASFTRKSKILRRQARKSPFNQKKHNFGFFVCTKQNATVVSHLEFERKKHVHAVDSEDENEAVTVGGTVEEEGDLVVSLGRGFGGVPPSCSSMRFKSAATCVRCSMHVTQRCRISDFSSSERL